MNPINKHMNPINKYKILSYYEDALNIKKGIMPAPRFAKIYPTYECNKRCDYCLYKNLTKTKKIYPFNALKNLIDELKEIGVKAIEFSGGEPTLYPNFEDIVNYIKSKGLELGVLTNGSTIKTWGQLLVDNCTYVRLAGEYASKEDIQELTKYKRTSNSKCIISIKALIGKHNKDKLEEIVDLTRYTGTDFLHLKGVRSDDNELSDDEKKEIDEALGFFNDNFPISGNMSTPKPKTKCFMSPIHTLIDPLGDVYICCFYHYRKDTHKIGNVLHDSFKSIWYSDLHKEAIEGIDLNKCTNYDCSFHNYNEIMNDVINNNSIHINYP